LRLSYNNVLTKYSLRTFDIPGNVGLENAPIENADWSPDQSCSTALLAMMEGLKTSSPNCSSTSFL